MMEDQHGPTPSSTIAAYAQMKPMAPPFNQQQAVEIQPQQKKMIYSPQHQQWISRNMNQPPFTVGQHHFVHNMEGQNVQQRTPIVHQSGPFGEASPPMNESEQRQQLGHKAQYLQTGRLQNSQLHAPQTHQQLQRQRQMEIFPPGQISQHMPRHMMQEISVHSYPEAEIPSSHSNAIHQLTVSSQQHFSQQGTHPVTIQPIRIRQTSSLSQMHPPPHQHRILVHQQTPLVPDSMPPPPTAPVVHPNPYIGSQSFINSILGEDSQQMISPKKKYRDLKKKFKCLVYENEYYQEELRNLQRKLLKLSRDKNFLLDRLGQYENLSESSDDSDASSKTLDDRGVQKTKRKQKQGPGRKRAAPNTGANSTAPKRSTNGTKGGTGRKKAEPEKNESCSLKNPQEETKNAEKQKESLILSGPNQLEEQKRGQDNEQKVKHNAFGIPSTEDVVQKQK